MTVLTRIVERTRRDLEERKQRRPMADLEHSLSPSDRSFFSALSAPGLGLIAEFKPASPSRGAIRPDADPERYARAYSRAAAAISVLTETPHFGGNHQLLEVFRASSNRPLLCKDFIVEPYQILEARAHGADAILLIASLHEAKTLQALLQEARALNMEALVETHDASDLERAITAGARVIGVNARDLRTLQINTEAALPLLEQIPAGTLRVAESGVQRSEQLDALRSVADAVLIGTALMQAERPEEAIARLGW